MTKHQSPDDKRLKANKIVDSITKDTTNEEIVESVLVDIDKFGRDASPEEKVLWAASNACVKCSTRAVLCVAELKKELAEDMKTWLPIRHYSRIIADIDSICLGKKYDIKK